MLVNWEYNFIFTHRKSYSLTFRAIQYITIQIYKLSPYLTTIYHGAFHTVGEAQPTTTTKKSFLLKIILSMITDHFKIYLFCAMSENEIVISVPFQRGTFRVITYPLRFVTIAKCYNITGNCDSTFFFVTFLKISTANFM